MRDLRSGRGERGAARTELPWENPVVWARTARGAQGASPRLGVPAGTPSPQAEVRMF